MVFICLIVNLVHTHYFFIAKSVVVSRKIYKAISSIVLGELSQRFLRHSIDVKCLGGTLVDVAKLDDTLQVGDLLRSQVLHPKIFGVWEN